MRPVSQAEYSLLHSFVREEKFRVLIRAKDGREVDISDRVLQIGVSHSCDDPVATADLEINDAWTVFGDEHSLNPLIASSIYNDPSPLLWPENEILIYCGLAPLGETPSQWALLFHGVLGDSISPSGRKDERKINVRARDLAKRLQDRIIRGEFIYGSEEGEAVVAVMQGLLNQHASDLGITLLVRDNPQFMIFPTKIGNCSVWEALQNLLKPTGFQCRYWFWPAGAVAYDCTGSEVTISQDGFYLTVIDPGRDRTTADDSLDASIDTINEESVEICEDTVRNSIWVCYYDRDTRQYMECHRMDAESIAKYGVRTMVIGQDDVPYIDTYPEAWDLAGVVLHDLSEVPATDRISCQLMYHIEPFDLLNVTNARLATGTQILGVTDVQFSMAPGEEFTMTITGTRDRVIGQVRTWLASSGGGTPISPPGTMLSGSAAARSEVGEDGSLLTEVILSVTPPPEAEVDRYEWRWAIVGEAQWHEETTLEPAGRLTGLPPGSTVAWTCRARLKGHER